MSSFKLLLAFGFVVASALARPADQPAAAPAPGASSEQEGDDDHKHGPFSAVYDKLDDAQKAKMKAIFTDASAKKAEIKEKVDNFVKELPDNIKAAADQAKQAIEAKKKEFAAKASSLGDAAKKAVADIQAIRDDDSLTKQQEREKIKDVLGKAGADIVKELKGAGIPVPAPAADQPAKSQ